MPGPNDDEAPEPLAMDEEIAGLWKRAMWEKKAGSGLDEPSFLQPDRPMPAIGG